MDKEDDDPYMLDWTFFSDEAWFHLTQYVNSQKTFLWSTENPHTHETLLPSVKNGLWCAVAQHHVPNEHNKYRN